MEDSVEINHERKTITIFGEIIGSDLILVFDEIRAGGGDPNEYIFIQEEDEIFYEDDEDDDYPKYTQDQLEKYAEGFADAAVKSYIAAVLYNNVRNNKN